jgi:hypothetical protein
MEAAVDAALLGIAASLGVPVQDLLRETVAGTLTVNTNQGVGEFCKGQFVKECGSVFGETGLSKACKTCPN